MVDEVMIEGGVAVITGAASGIGTGLARKAAEKGMKLVLADVNADLLNSFAKSIDADVLAIPTDVTDMDAVDKLAEQAWQRFGQVDALFNNAGVMATGFTWEIEPRRWRQSMAVNVDGVFHGIRAFVPRLLAAQRPAHIVNTASVGGFLPSPLMAPYSTTKAAVVALTESLHLEMQMIGAPVRVSLLAPGPVQSSIFNDPFGDKVTPETAAFVDTMRTMLTANGLSPDDFAERVFAAMADGEYWIIPQPEALDPLFDRRVQAITGRQAPQNLDFSKL